MVDLDLDVQLPKGVKVNPNGTLKLPKTTIQPKAIHRRISKAKETKPMTEKPQTKAFQSQGEDLSHVKRVEDMSTDERAGLNTFVKGGPRVHILVLKCRGENQDTYMMAASNVRVEKLIAFSHTARAEFEHEDWNLLKVRHLYLEPFPVSAVRVLLSWMERTCTYNNRTKLSTSYMSVEEWIALWLLVEDMKIPLAQKQLRDQLDPDLASLTFSATLEAWELSQNAGLEEVMHLAAFRLSTFSTGNSYSTLQLRDIDMLITKAVSEDFTEVAVEKWARKNFQQDCAVDKLKPAGASEALSQRVIQKWGAWRIKLGEQCASHRESALNSPGCYARREEQRPLEDLWTFDANVGQVIKVQRFR